MRNLYSHNTYNPLPGIDLFVCIIEMRNGTIDYYLRLNEHRDNSHLRNRINRIIRELRNHFYSRFLSIEIFQVAELYDPCIKYLMSEIKRTTYDIRVPIGTHVLYRQYAARASMGAWFINKGGRIFTLQEAFSQGNYGRY